jgi:hypothetical protein
VILKLRAAPHYWGSAVAFGLPFVLYLATLAPTVYNLDSAELSVAAYTGGLTRATGYPLYLILGWFWSRLPIGDVGYRMNLFSAFTGALTVALAEHILRRLAVGPWARMGALGLLAASVYFWAMSLVAEVYTLHTALVAGLVLLLLAWGEQPTPHRLLLLGLLVGLSMGHHAATVLLLPGCAWYLLTTAPGQVLTPRALLLGAGAWLVGFSIYLYLPWRYGMQPAFNYAGTYDATGALVPINLQSPVGLWWLISGRKFGNWMFAYSGGDLWLQAEQFLIWLWRAFLGVGIGPGLVGLLALLQRDWRLGGALLWMFGGHAAFYVDYLAGDKEMMFLPTYLVFALWVGVGYQWLLDWLEGSGGGALLRGVMAGAVLFGIGWNWPLVNLSQDWSARRYGEAILEQVEPDALILGWWSTAPLIRYLQLVEGQRLDVQVVNRSMIDDEKLCLLLQQELDTTRPVYADHLDFSPELLARITSHKNSTDDPLYRLYPAHATNNRTCQLFASFPP